MIPYLSPVIACVLTLLFISMLKPAAIHIGLIDEPGGRKAHSGKIPLIGGIAMFLGFTFSILLLNTSLSIYRPFVAGSALMVIVGILDDFHELSARTRIAAQIIAGCMMTLWGGMILHQFGNLLYFGNIHLSYLAIPVTVFAVVGIINAVNMIDGVDGLAGCISLTQVLLLALLAYLAKDIVSLQILMILSASLLAFLIFNFRSFYNKKALVFMGDAGSMFLGFVLAWFLVSLSQGQHAAARPVTMLWIMVVPLFDTGRLLIQRAIHKRSPFSPDSNHFHHLLLAYGVKPFMVTLLLSFITVVFGVIGIIGGIYHIADALMFVTFIALFIVYYFVCRFLTMYSKELKLNEA